jgi:hypothetical protein
MWRIQCADPDRRTDESIVSLSKSTLSRMRYPFFCGQLFGHAQIIAGSSAAETPDNEFVITSVAHCA